MIYYFDTSALIKRYIKEPMYEEVISLFDKEVVIGSIILTKVEIASALTKAVRMNWINFEEMQSAWQKFLTQWTSFTRIAISSSIIDRASLLTREYSLRAYDAMHLAAVLNWQDTLEISVTLATFDRELWLAGKKAGLSVWPKEL
jgi:uncharacterized protein